MMPLSEICSIQIGQSLSRTKVPGDSSEACCHVSVLMPKALGENGIAREELDEIAVSFLNDKLLTCCDDVVMKLSTAYETVYITKEHCGLLVPSFCVLLRPRSRNVNMRYLAAYLNATNTRAKLKSLATGQSSIRILKKRDLESLMIPLPSQSAQERIAALAENVLERRKLALELIEKDKLLLEGELYRARDERSGLEYNAGGVGDKHGR